MESSTQLLETLEKDLNEKKLPWTDQEALLTRLKISSRDIKSAAPLFTRNSIKLVATYGLDSTTQSVSYEALKCLANVLVLHESSRKTLVELQFVPKLVERLAVTLDDDEFLVSKILFLLTYNAILDVSHLIDKQDLAGKILGQLSRHADHARQQPSAQPPGVITSNMALGETLKLLFNITHFYPDVIDNLHPATPVLVQILLHHDLPTPPLQPPVSLLINALLNLDLPAQDTREELTNRLVEILDRALQTHPEKDLDTVAAPLVTLLRRICDDGPAAIRDQLRQTLLPSTADRDRPLGHGSSLPSRLLRLCTSAHSPLLRDNVSGLLFELSDKDPATFVRNVGYGYAAGFLMNHNLPVPTTASNDAGAVDDEPTNPVTGQRLSAELRDGPEDTLEMTEEEREREAERLYVLFERLRATGVVDVRNPVQDAINEGRFEELPD